MLYATQIDPLSRLTITASSNHIFTHVRPYPIFKIAKNSSQNSDRYWRDCESVRGDQ